jgi:hypothetical protein
MFDWLVGRVNASMAPPPDAVAGGEGVIGILDIFGTASVCGHLKFTLFIWYSFRF